jgi:hypothetical protein
METDEIIYLSLAPSCIYKLGVTEDSCVVGFPLNLRVWVGGRKGTEQLQSARVEVRGAHNTNA